MAVKNGLINLQQQIESILNQNHCHVSLLVSDDFSTDGSTQFLQLYSKNKENIKLLPNTHAYGSAAKNFFRLILEVEPYNYDFIAFSDQDDIWLPDKLIRHIQLARDHNADGISSNVLAFWPNGHEILLDKAQPQRELDFLFESAGPGCTFLMTPWLVGKVREQLLDENNPAKNIAFHDWLTYAVCRAYGHKWIIDSEPSVKYRQHQTNVIGANVGISAKCARVQSLKQRWYRNEVIKIAKVCYKISTNTDIYTIIMLLQNKKLFPQTKLLFYIAKSRRKALDRFFLGCAILTGLF